MKACKLLSPLKPRHKINLPSNSFWHYYKGWNSSQEKTGNLRQSFLKLTAKHLRNPNKPLVFTATPLLQHHPVHAANGSSHHWAALQRFLPYRSSKLSSRQDTHSQSLFVLSAIKAGIPPISVPLPTPSTTAMRAHSSFLFVFMVLLHQGYSLGLWFPY